MKLQTPPVTVAAWLTPSVVTTTVMPAGEKSLTVPLIVGVVPDVPPAASPTVMGPIAPIATVGSVVSMVTFVAADALEVTPPNVAFAVTT